MTHQGKIAVVTGAANGIGLGIAKKLCEEGAKVVLCDINAAEAGRQAGLLRENGLEATAVACDVSRPADLQAVAAAARQGYGGLDILVNNAGILDSSPVLEMTEETWDRVLAVNLKSVFFACQAAIPLLKKSPAPRIVNVSSLAGRMGGYETGLAYSASKGGILSLTMGLARQLAPFGITVNSLCPGTTESDIIRQWSGEQIEALKSRIPLGRLGKIEDMASAAAFLTSTEAGFITGLFLDVNGGMYMG
jgi:3-oxoacyl-[acyl-carrier protein] reductase